MGTFTNSEDFALFPLGFQIYIQGIAQALQAIGPLSQLNFPDPAILNDPLLLAAFIKENVSCNEHFQNHCRMTSLAQGGVVDSTGQWSME